MGSPTLRERQPLEFAAMWGEARPIHELCPEDLGTEGLVFLDGNNLYRTTGRHLANGGMGSVFEMERRAAHDSDSIEYVVAKTFHAEYLYQLRTDEVTRGEHTRTLQAIDHIAQLSHDHLLPTYVSTSIRNNHLFITPRQGETLLAAVSRNAFTERERVLLIIQALRALESLHNAGILHRDFTLRNILLGNAGAHAYLFDFDLAVTLKSIAHQTYKSHYRGRIFGSPGFSVPPEVLDPALTETAITHRLDIYAVGAAIFSLFTDQLPYGDTEDMWGLLVRIAEGIVINGQSRVVYPEAVPHVLRPIIEACLERDPGNRTASVSAIIDALELCVDQLDASSQDRHTTLVPGTTLSRKDRVDAVHGKRPDNSVTKAVIEIVDQALTRYGYEVEQSLGRVRGKPIFRIVPIPALVANGEFPDTNTFPKIVTAQNLNQADNPESILDLWFGQYLPILHSVRRGSLTAFYRGVYDELSGHLFLFSECVDDPRFGTDLARHELSLAESLGLGYLVANQVASLHSHGMSHNNVCPQSLLLKGLRKTREVKPAMVGLTDPSLDPQRLKADVRNLAYMIADWTRAEELQTLEDSTRQQLTELQHSLRALALAERDAPLTIDIIIDKLANGLAALDVNFRVLQQHGGDLQAYALLLVSHSLYGRLWSQ